MTTSNSYIGSNTQHRLSDQVSANTHDPPDTREQPAASDRGSRAIPSRVARILWLLPDPTSADPPGGMDPPKATSVPLAAMAKRSQPLQRTATAWPAKAPRGGCCRI